MAETIDINKPRREAEKTEDLKVALQTLFTQVIEAQNVLNMRLDDLLRDQAKLSMNVEELIGGLYEKYPELEPDLEEEVDEVP